MSSASRSVLRELSPGAGGRGCTPRSHTASPEGSRTPVSMDGTSSCTRNLTSGSINGYRLYMSMP
jgi:hypothetical protein